MSIQTCNLCNESINKPGMGGTTVGVSLETNQITVSHTRCRDMYTKEEKPMQVPTDMHSEQEDSDPIADLDEWERQVLAADGFDC